MRSAHKAGTAVFRFSLEWLWSRDNVRLTTTELLQQLATSMVLCCLTYGVTDAAFGSIRIGLYLEL